MGNLRAHVCTRCTRCGYKVPVIIIAFVVHYRMKSCLERIKHMLPEHSLAKRKKSFASANKAVYPHFLSFLSFREEQGQGRRRHGDINNNRYNNMAHIAVLTHATSVANRYKDCDWMHSDFAEGLYSCGALPESKDALTRELLMFANYAAPNASERLTRALLEEDLKELVACRFGSSSSSNSSSSTTTAAAAAVTTRVFGSNSLGLSIFSSDVDVSIGGLLSEEEGGRGGGSSDKAHPDALAEDFTASMAQMERREAEMQESSNSVAAARAKVLALAQAGGRYESVVALTGSDDNDNSGGEEGWALDAVPDAHSSLPAAGTRKRRRDSSDDDSDHISLSDSDNDSDDENQLDLNLNSTQSADNAMLGAWSSVSTKNIRSQQCALWNSHSNTPDRNQSTLAVQERRKKKILHELVGMLKHLRSMAYVHTFEFISKARVPIINFTHVNGVECDVSVGISANDTTDVIKAMVLSVYNYAHFRSQSRRIMVDTTVGATLQPEIVGTIRHIFFPLVCFLKVFLSLANMNKPFSGGLGAFKVYVMLTNVLLTCPADMLRFDSVTRFGSVTAASASASATAGAKNVDLGAVLMRFLEYFGNPHNLNTSTEISVGLNCLPADVSLSKTVEIEFRAQFKVDYCCFLFRKVHQTVQAMQNFNNSRANQRLDSLLGCVLDVKSLLCTRNKSSLKAEIYNRTRLGGNDAGQHLAAFGRGEGAELYSQRKNALANAILAKMYREIVQSNTASGKRNIYSVFSQITIADVKAQDLGLYGRLRGFLTAVGAYTGGKSMSKVETSFARTPLETADGDSNRNGAGSAGTVVEQDTCSYSAGGGGSDSSDEGGDGLGLLDYARLRYQRHTVFTGKDSNGNRESTSAGTGGKAKSKGDRLPPGKKRRLQSPGKPADRAEGLLRMSQSQQQAPRGTLGLSASAMTVVGVPGQKKQKKQKKQKRKQQTQPVQEEGLAQGKGKGNGKGKGKGKGKQNQRPKAVKAANGSATSDTGTGARAPVQFVKHTTVGSAIKQYENQKLSNLRMLHA